MHRQVSVMNAGRAIVIGGSLGGLFAANLLRSIGWEVEIFERAEDDLADRGAGIIIHREMLAVMRRTGLAIDESYGIAVSDRCIFDRSGAIVASLEAPRLMSAAPRVACSASMDCGGIRSGSTVSKLTRRPPKSRCGHCPRPATSGSRAGSPARRAPHPGWN